MAIISGPQEGVRSGEAPADTLLPRLLCRDPVREPETDGDPRPEADPDRLRGVSFLLDLVSLKPSASLS